MRFYLGMIIGLLLMVNGGLLLLLLALPSRKEKTSEWRTQDSDTSEAMSTSTRT